MTRKQKATYFMLVINTVIVNAIYFGYFYHDPFSLDTIWAFVIVSVFTVFGHFCFLQEHVLLQHMLPNKEPMLLRNETPSFMDSDLFYYEADGQIRLGEAAQPELVKEVNDYIRSYILWLEQWQSNKHKVSGD
jgi:hypothetical protein